MKAGYSTPTYSVTRVSGNMSCCRARLNEVGFGSCRRLGDVVSSLLFLGYNESQSSHSASDFLKQLRRTTVARIYADEIDFSSFLGRSTRLSSRNCTLDLPNSLSDSLFPTTPQADPQVGEEHAILLYNEAEVLDYCNIVRWVYLCAVLKEEALDILRSSNGRDCHERIA